MLFALAFLFATARPVPYHVQLEANPAAPFPFLSKFGTVTLHVYPAGVRAETVWLNAFSRLGTTHVTVENPLGRMYTDVPIAEITSLLRKMSNDQQLQDAAPAPIEAPVSGNVAGIRARRYRIAYGPEGWIDVWTTDVVPENRQLRSIVEAFVRGIAPATASSIQSITGMPVYVELNFRRYKKLPLLQLKTIAFSNVGQEKALSTGRLYIKAPMLDAVWK